MAKFLFQYLFFLYFHVFEKNAIPKRNLRKKIYLVREVFNSAYFTYEKLSSVRYSLYSENLFFQKKKQFYE